MKTAVNKPGSKRRVGRGVFFVTALVLLYVLASGILPFARHKAVSESFADAVSPAAFYGDAPCVDRVALVETPAEGLRMRLHMLDEATERIDVSYYAIQMGETSDWFLGALLDAADRGVRVRILVDGMFGGLTRFHKDYAVALGAHPNIEVRVYNPPQALMPWTWNGRLHDKYILVDDRLLLMGGRNIGDTYFAPEGYEKSLTLDRDVLVYNTAGKDGETSALFAVRRYMDTIWESDDVRAPFACDTRRGAAKRQALLEAYHRLAADSPALFDHENDDYAVWTYAASRVTFFHNDTQMGVKEPKVGYVLGELLTNAATSVVMQTPYVIPDEMLTGLLRELRDRGIDATLLTNSMATSPNPIAYSTYYGYRRTIAQSGVHLLEYQGANSLHAKTYLIDDRLAVMGSYNLDPRSAYIDTEVMLAIDSPELVQCLKMVQEAYGREALAVMDDGEYAADSAVAVRDVPVWKRTVIYALFLPAKAFRFLV